MKKLFPFLFVFIFFEVNAQDRSIIKDIDTTNTISDNSSFIEAYNRQLNIKFDLSNEIETYHIPFEEKSVIIAPNLGLRYALVFNYRFVSFRLGFRPKQSFNSKENEGNSNAFRFKIKFLFKNWYHLIEYNYLKGYYIKNSNEFTLSDKNRKLQLPDLTTNVFSGSSAYKLNKNYSLKAIQSQSEIQIKSVGSFMPSIDYWIYSIKGTDRVINTDGDEILRENYNTYLGFNTILNIGYYYTYVYKKNWYAHVYGIPGLGMDLYKIDKVNSGITSNDNYIDFITSFQTGSGLGYNSKRYYFGIDLSYRFTSEKYDENRIQFNTSKKTFHLFVGYRFKAPKKVRNTVDKIEEKVPILNENNR